WGGLATDVSEEGQYDEAFRLEVQAQLAQEERIERENARPRPQTAADAAADAMLNAPISLGEVRDSMRDLQSAKAPGCDGIVAEALKKGGESMAKALHVICVQAFASGKVPLSWMRGIIVPIHKDGGLRVPANYRPITVLSILAKVYA